MFLSLFALCSVLTSGSYSYAKCGEVRSLKLHLPKSEYDGVYNWP